MYNVNSEAASSFGMIPKAGNKNLAALADEYDAEDLKENFDIRPPIPTRSMTQPAFDIVLEIMDDERVFSPPLKGSSPQPPPPSGTPANHNLPPVLVLTPLSPFSLLSLSTFYKNICRLSYPRSLTSVGFLIGADEKYKGSQEAIARNLRSFQKYGCSPPLVHLPAAVHDTADTFARMTIIRSPPPSRHLTKAFGTPPSSKDSSRHLFVHQPSRRAQLSAERNRLLTSTLGLADKDGRLPEWILWIDSDVVGWGAGDEGEGDSPITLVEDLLKIAGVTRGEGKTEWEVGDKADIVAPSVVWKYRDLDESGKERTKHIPYDLNYWIETDESRKIRESLVPSDILFEGRWFPRYRPVYCASPCASRLCLL